MALVKCFGIAGLYLWFPSNDHLPPHFHAKRRGEWEICVNFLVAAGDEMFRVVWMSGQLSKQDRKVLVEAVAEHRTELLREWEKCQQDQ
jgi:hypothetical protein